MSKILLGTILISCILCLAFWTRTQDMGRIPDGQFTGTDAYLYYWQAYIVSEQGILPARDMHRWLPLGRDLGQTLNLYSYVQAYAHKTIARWFPNVSLYQVALYAPPVCFIIGLGVLCLFLCRTYGLLFSSIVGVLLAILPGSISRSSAGFSDRDSWCLMLAVLVVTSYLASLQTPSPRRRILWTLISGVIVFLGGISWEGFGFFVGLILALELWRFCTTETEKHRKVYLLWILMFVPTLYLASPAYRSGYGFSTHVAALMLFPPLVIFLLRNVRYLLLDFFKQLRPYARHIAWLLTLGSLAVGICYIVISFDTFALTAYPFHENRLMRSIRELADPQFVFWKQHYGSVFVLGSLGLIIESLRIWKWNGIPLASSLTLFGGTTFFRWHVSKYVGTDVCNILFFSSLILVPVGLGIASLRKEKPDNESGMLIAIVWFLLWVSLAREGKRYSFFIGVPLAFGTASLLWNCPLHLIQWFKEKLGTGIETRWVTTGFTIAVFALVLFWISFEGYAKRVIHKAPQIRQAVPGQGEIADAFQWMNATLPQNAVVAANWSYGSQLNVLGGVKTITDQDHFIPHWVHLYYRHVFCAQSEQEALSFLKSHEATHLMLTQEGIISRSRNFSFIGSDVNADRRFRISEIHRDRKNSTETHYRMVPRGRTPLASVEIDVVSTEKRAVTIQFKTQDAIVTEVIWDAKKPSVIGFGDSGMTLYFDFEGKPYIGYYIPPLGWNTLAVKLFVRGKHSPAFEAIYPIHEETFGKVKVWEIRYPPDIKTDPRFLGTRAGATLQ